jgi:hypothetical protein
LFVEQVFGKYAKAVDESMKLVMFFLNVFQHLQAPQRWETRIPKLHEDRRNHLLSGVFQTTRVWIIRSKPEGEEDKGQ